LCDSCSSTATIEQTSNQVTAAQMSVIELNTNAFIPVPTIRIFQQRAQALKQIRNDNICAIARSREPLPSSWPQKLFVPLTNSHFVSASEDTRCRTMLYCYKNGRDVLFLGPSLLDISCYRTWSALLEPGRRWSSSTGGPEGEAYTIGLLSSAGAALANTNKTLQVSPFWFIDLHGRYCHLVHAFYQ
jgi:hypothetical protein